MWSDSEYLSVAMLTNEYVGSGGDLIPWFFHNSAVGTLVGERTWGGEVGIAGYPPLIDGGTTTDNDAFAAARYSWSPSPYWQEHLPIPQDQGRPQ